MISYYSLVGWELYLILTKTIQFYAKDQQGSANYQIAWFGTIEMYLFYKFKGNIIYSIKPCYFILVELIDFDIELKRNKFMPVRQRQFSQVRSNVRSKSQSLCASSVKQKSQFNFSMSQRKDECVSCVNQKLTVSKRQCEKKKAEEQIDEHLKTLKRINSMKDYQQQYRQKKLHEAAQYNKSMLSSQISSAINLKKVEYFQDLQQIQKDQRQFANNQESAKRTRRKLESKYHEQIRSQVKEEKSRKDLQRSRSKFQDPSEVNRLKVIQENQSYVNLMRQEKKKVQKQNRKQILLKTFTRHEQKQRTLKEDIQHMQRTQQDFAKFTEFQPLQSSPFRASRTILSSQNNPEDVFAQLKRLQTQKKLSQKSQRKLNNNERVLQLRKLEQQNRQKVQMKLSSMKNYVEDLTKQLIEKNQKKRQQNNYMRHYQPKKSKVDYYTQQIQKDIKPCNTCDKTYESRFIGV